MSRYRKGAIFEREVRKFLEDRGFYVVRAASSKPIDLICIKDGEVYLVECKSSLNQVNRRVLREMREISKKTGVKSLIAVKKDKKVAFIDPMDEKEIEFTECR